MDRHPGWTTRRTDPLLRQDMEWWHGCRHTPESFDQRRAFADNRRARLRIKRARRVLYRVLGRQVAKNTTLRVERVDAGEEGRKER